MNVFEKQQDVFYKSKRQNCVLKELKSKKNKEKTAPAPHRKEKTIKEKSQKTTHTYIKGAASLFDCTKKRFCVMVTQRRSFLGKFHILFLGVTKLIPNFAIDMCVIASVLTLVSRFEFNYR